MFGTIKAHIENMGTIKSLCERAEKHALRDEQHEPGAEHFVLAAIDLSDGTAKQAFEKIGLDATSFGDAIQNQYEDALRSIGLDPHMMPEQSTGLPAIGERRGAYSAAASGKAVMQTLADKRRNHDPLLGAHVIAVVADMEHGVAARALHAMSADRAALKRAAEDVIRDFSAI